MVWNVGTPKMRIRIMIFHGLKPLSSSKLSKIRPPLITCELCGVLISRDVFLLWCAYFITCLSCGVLISLLVYLVVCRGGLILANFELEKGFRPWNILILMFIFGVSTFQTILRCWSNFTRSGYGHFKNYPALHVH